MQQTYRRTPMTKCDFNKNAKQHSVKHFFQKKFAFRFDTWWRWWIILWYELLSFFTSAVLFVSLSRKYLLDFKSSETSPVDNANNKANISLTALVVTVKSVLVFDIASKRYDVMQGNFIKIALRYGCSHVNLLHIFRTPFPKSTSEGLLSLCYSSPTQEKSSFLSFSFTFQPQKFMSYKYNFESIYIGALPTLYPYA